MKKISLIILVFVVGAMFIMSSCSEKSATGVPGEIPQLKNYNYSVDVQVVFGQGNFTVNYPTEVTGQENAKPITEGSAVVTIIDWDQLNPGSSIISLEVEGAPVALSQEGNVKTAILTGDDKLIQGKEVEFKLITTGGKTFTETVKVPAELTRKEFPNSDKDNWNKDVDMKAEWGMDSNSKAQYIAVNNGGIREQTPIFEFSREARIVGGSLWDADKIADEGKYIYQSIELLNAEWKQASNGNQKSLIVIRKYDIEPIKSVVVNEGWGIVDANSDFNMIVQEAAAGK
jgi:hypothetical protein